LFYAKKAVSLSYYNNEIMRRKLLFTVYSTTLFVLLIFAGCEKNDTETADAFSTGDSVVINGVTWATRNVDDPGTFAATPESLGMFYQLNRKVGWTATDPRINSDGGTTWDSSVPSGTEWEKANDPCPTGWRVPTTTEQQSLLDAGSSWTTLNGVIGRIFGTGSNTLFLPAAGYRDCNDGTLYNVRTNGYYWSSTQSGSSSAYNLGFDSGGAFTYYYYDRSYGFSVRCVQE
jgi:hypothetical protein